MNKQSEMKAEINKNGVLTVYAENELEKFALEEWYIKNINGYTLAFKEEHPRCFTIDTQYPRITVFERMWLRIRLFLYR